MARCHTNSDRHCLSQGDCRATGKGLCRQCAMRCGRYSAARKQARMSAARKQAWADPAVRARMSAASKQWMPPPGFEDTFKILKKKLGVKEARMLVLADVDRAAKRKGKQS